MIEQSLIQYGALGICLLGVAWFALRQHEANLRSSAQHAKDLREMAAAHIADMQGVTRERVGDMKDALDAALETQRLTVLHIGEVRSAVEKNTGAIERLALDLRDGTNRAEDGPQED